MCCLKTSMNLSISVGNRDIFSGTLTALSSLGCNSLNDVVEILNENLSISSLVGMTSMLTYCTSSSPVGDKLCLSVYN